MCKSFSETDCLSISSPLLSPLLSKVIALMFREASMASLSARVESSFDASCNAYFLYGLHHFVFYLMSFRKNPLGRDITYLCREYDAHVTLVHIHSTQVWSVEGGALEVIVLLNRSLIWYFFGCLHQARISLESSEGCPILFLDTPPPPQ